MVLDPPLRAVVGAVIHSNEFARAREAINIFIVYAAPKGQIDIFFIVAFGIESAIISRLDS
jgi:hypothetical protein